MHATHGRTGTDLKASTRLRLLARHLPWRAPTTADVAKRRVQLSLGVLLARRAAGLATGLVAAFSLYHSAESRYVDVVFPLRTATRDLVLGMVDEEAGIRGYMITSDRQSLALYFRGRKSVDADLAQIAQLTRGQPGLSTRLQALRTEVRGLHGYYARLIALIAEHGLSPAQARARLLDDASAFTRFRHTADLLQNDLDAFVESTRVSQRTTFYRAVGTLGVAGALGLAIAAALLLGVPERLRLLYLGEERARRRAEQGANAARALEHVSDAVVLVDDTGHVRSWNPGAERLFGVGAGSAVGRPAVELVPELARLAAGGEELVPVPLEGEERWFASSASRFDGGIVLTVRDATTAHLLERARTEFVATASHELRTPLTSIYGAAQTLLGREGLSEEVRHELMRIIGSESVHLARIVDQLLVTAQLTRGRLTLNETDCDVRALCADVLAVAETRLPDGATLALTAPPVVERYRCDEGLLRQVLVNLVDNALKYSPDGGRVEIHLEDGADLVRIEVRDEGLGIAPSEQERIFEKFYRLDAEMTRGVGGSGLGLHIAREIVEQMGGTISVRSAQGEGSTFTLSLPRV